MYSDRSYPITEQEYNYLLPALHRKYLLCHERGYYFIEQEGESLDFMLDRLKGLYEAFEVEIPKILVYDCFIERSIEKFRKLVKAIDFVPRNP